MWSRLIPLRTFEDSKGIFYPRNTNLLVVVAKSTDKNELWFSFELRLEWKLKVDIHGFVPRVARLVARADKHDGWCFKIRGQHNPTTAKAALEDAKVAEGSNWIPLFIGLRAAETVDECTDYVRLRSRTLVYTNIITSISPVSTPALEISA